MNLTEVFTWGVSKTEQASQMISLVPRQCAYNISLVKVACGASHTTFLSNSGHLYSLGSNFDGKLGVGDIQLKSCDTPMLVQALVDKPLIDIACGENHSAALTQQGEVYMWGSGQLGVLGFGDTYARWFPYKLGISAKVVSVSCGGNHTAAITRSESCSKAFVWGSNLQGQLGTGCTQVINTPMGLKIKKPQVIKCGKRHTLILVDGRVFASGCNQKGELGNNSRKSSSFFTPVLGLKNCEISEIAAGGISAAVSTKGEIFVWGTNECLSPQKIGEGFVKFYVGDEFGIAMDKMNRVWAWGNNRSGELGVGDLKARKQIRKIPGLKNKEIKSVCCYGHSTVALAQLKKKNITVNLEGTQRTISNNRKESSSTLQSTNRTRCMQDFPKRGSVKFYIKLVKDYILYRGDNQNIQSALDMILQKYQRISYNFKKSTEKSQSKIAAAANLAECSQRSIIIYKKQIETNKQEIQYIKGLLKKQTKESSELIDRLQTNLEEEKQISSKLRQDLESLHQGYFKEIKEKQDDLEVLRKQNSILRTTIESVQSQKKQYQSLYNTECQHRKQVAAQDKLFSKLGNWGQSHVYDLINKVLEQENSIQELRSIVQQYQYKMKHMQNQKQNYKKYLETPTSNKKDPFGNIEKDLISKAAEHKMKTLQLLSTPTEQGRYCFSPNMSQISQVSPRIQLRRLSELSDYSRPSLVNIQEVSYQQAQELEQNSPIFRINTPPTFREGCQDDGKFRKSIEKLVSRIEEQKKEESLIGQ